MKSKSKELLYLIGFILWFVVSANAILVKLYGGITFITTIAAYVGLFIAGYGVFSKTKNLLGPKLNKKKKILAIASPFITLLIWVLIGILVNRQLHKGSNEPVMDTNQKGLEDRPKAPGEEELLELRAIEAEKRREKEMQYKFDYEEANQMNEKELENLQKKDSVKP